jgi:hypothetical protein
VLFFIHLRGGILPDVGPITDFLNILVRALISGVLLLARYRRLWGSIALD